MSGVPSSEAAVASRSATAGVRGRAGDTDDAGARGLQLADRGLEGGPTATVDDHGRAGGDERPGDLEPDAARRAGDDGDAAVEREPTFLGHRGYSALSCGPPCISAISFSVTKSRLVPLPQPA